MEFCDSAATRNEDMKIPRDAVWYEKLLMLPNQAFGEQVLAVKGMSDKWPQDKENVPVLLLGDEGKSPCFFFLRNFRIGYILIIASCSNVEVALYHCTFPAHASVMGVRPMRDGEEYWSKQIRPNFMYARADLFAAPPIAIEGTHIPNPRPCRAITLAGKEVVYLSS
ncbi:hypothetical protein Hdeb2414_s0001g00025251 [Helianthus debilis subsp. tardiflorus]